ncbi:MAG: endopeptidase La [Alphaproteobacteria bacterium]|jgi:ATP-dependent Lon protease|nr:endopeptidase La [Alphaproteobacteria bacterium]
MNKENNVLPLIALPTVVIFPHMIVSLFVDREKSINALNSVTKDSNKIIVVSQKEPNVDDVQEKDLYNIGTLVEIIQIVKMPDGSVKIAVRGLERVKISGFKDSKGYMESSYEILVDSKNYDEAKLTEVKEALFLSLKNYIDATKRIPNTLLPAVRKIESLDEALYLIISHVAIAEAEKQKILEMDNLLERVAYVNSILEVELDLLGVEKKIRERVKKQMEKNQKDYYLNEQIKAIQKELNNGEEVKDEVKELLLKAKKTKLTKEAREKLEPEIKKLAMMNPISAEATVLRNYVDWVLSLPWDVKAGAKIDLKKAEEYLEEEHYALGKVKERILEYLAVLKKSPKMKSPILLLVGPPGVGKTSLAKSIAKASNREFVRISLGGVKDESEIRGHRRTYIGAMPGKLIQAMKKVKVSNPLILLDEIDKMSSDFRGDPSSALLEVLDKEQNGAFVDHYIEVGYDLSNVMFIATANSLNMQEALIDRMEVIQLSGYSEDEKLEIAKRHLIPREMTEAALDESEIKIEDKAILELIRNYTRESGVRKLEEVIASVARKVAMEIVMEKIKSAKITPKNLIDYAGVPKFKDSDVEKENKVGITTGLAWTRVGGDILYIEALKLPGKGEVKMTGKLGEVMQESVRAAYSLLQANASELGLAENLFSDFNLHIHVPEGATPKDGPSAGVAMTTSMYSALSGKKVRSDVAMTGEITLRGKVLPIGGLREKILAALRFGITNIIIPKDNESDLKDIPENSLKQLKIISVSDFREVLDFAIVKEK